MRIILALATVIISFSVLVFLWRLKIKEQKNIRNRMAYFSGSIAARQEQIRQGNRNVDLKTRFREIVHQLAVKLQKVQKNNPMDAKMQQADWPLMGTEFEIMLLIFGLLLGLVVFLTTNADNFGFSCRDSLRTAVFKHLYQPPAAGFYQSAWRYAANGFQCYAGRI